MNKENSLIITIKTDGLTTLSSNYAESTASRAIISCIPYIGGALDIIISKKGREYQTDRINDFLRQLDARICALESASPTIEASEVIFDTFSVAAEAAVRTSAAPTRMYLASTVANGVATNEWDQALESVRLLAELSHSHVEILKAISESLPVDGVWNGQRVASIQTNRQSAPPLLADLVPSINPAILQKLCSDLVARGLLLDEGVGRLDTRVMEFFRVSDFGNWFLARVLPPSNPPT